MNGEKAMFQNNYEEEQNIGQIDYDNKMPINTLVTLRHSDSILNSNTINPQFKKSLSEMDISFQNQIYQNNSQLFRLHMIEYLNSCLKEKINAQQIFINQTLFIFDHEVDEDSESSDWNIVIKIENNKLLNQSHKKLLENCYKTYQQFRHFYAALNASLKRSIFQEIQYLISVVLEHKLPAFQSLSPPTLSTVIPQFPRFYGEEQNENIADNPSYFENYLDYSVIKKFASLGVEDFSTKVYFSNNIKFLNFKKITVDLCEVNLIEKFSSFMVFISEVLFLTLGGHSLPQQQLDLFKQQMCLNLEENQQGFLNNSLNKKIKFDFL